MFKMNARRCLVIIKYNDKDISADLQQYLKNVSYTDNMSGEADDLQLTLEDKAGLWQSAWMPEKGATLDVSVKLINWQSIGEQVVRFGLFEIDEITSSGMPSEVQIKAVSVPDNNNLRGAERTRSWEKAELKRIANDIATEAGLTLYYDVKEYNPVIDRAEQTEQSDLSFLYKLLLIMAWHSKSVISKLLFLTKQIMKRLRLWRWCRSQKSVFLPAASRCWIC